jgi:hypothetical protein
VIALVPALQPSSMLRPRGASGYAIRTVQTESISNRWASNGELLPRIPFRDNDPPSGLRKAYFPSGATIKGLSDSALPCSVCRG